MLDLIFNNKFWPICSEKWDKGMLKISDCVKMNKSPQKIFSYPEEYNRFIKGVTAGIITLVKPKVFGL